MQYVLLADGSQEYWKKNDNRLLEQIYEWKSLYNFVGMFNFLLLIYLGLIGIKLK